MQPTKNLLIVGRGTAGGLDDLPTLAAAGHA